MLTVMVQCLPCGHSYESDKPEHIERDKVRAAKGYIDALPIPSEDCEICQNERENRYIDPLLLGWDEDLTLEKKLGA